MSCDVGKVTERLENELCSFSNLSVTLHLRHNSFPQPFRRFTYVTAHSPTLPLLHLRHISFSNPSFGSPTSQALHLIHQACRPCHRLISVRMWAASNLFLYLALNVQVLLPYFKVGVDIILCNIGTLRKHRYQ